MKNLAIPSVLATTLVLAALFVASFVGAPLAVMLLLCYLGFLLVPFMVFFVLTDSYTTNKRFKDWYEDHPRVRTPKI